METTEPKNIGTKMPDDKKHLRMQQMCWKKNHIKSILVYTKNLLTIVKKKLQTDIAPSKL